jgi:phage terminase large subunit-like protein
MTEQSPIVELLTELVALGAVDEALAELTELELCGLAAEWDLWARPDQAIPPTIELSDPPPDGEKWPRWGRTRPGKAWQVIAFIGGRGTGKTSPNARHVHKMAMAMMWPRILLMAQSDDDAIKIFVDAENGLIEGAPPWERPYYTAGRGGKGGRIIWPSGAMAMVTSAGSKFERGSSYHGAWLTELTDWPNNRRKAAWDHVLASVRLADGQILIDTTPCAGHPVIEEIKETAEVDERWWWVRHEPNANRLFLVPGYLERLARATKGTRRYDEEVQGTEAAQRGLVKMADIEATRRARPAQLKRQIVVLDPTGADPTKAPKIDTVGLMRWGLCLDDQLMPLEDRTDRKDPEVYAAESVVMYIRGKCDCLVIETDRGGVLPSRLVAAVARDIAPLPGESPERTRQLAELRKALNGTVWRVEVVSVSFQTRFQHGVIYVREVRTWADRQTRASLLGQLYHQHRVSHPFEVDLDTYETTITTHEFRPREQSPGDLDCGTWAAVELTGAYQDLKMGSKGQQQLNEAARQQHQQAMEQARRPVGYIRQPAGRGRERDTRSRI